MEIDSMEEYILNCIYEKGSIRRVLEIVLVDRLKTRGYLDVERFTYSLLVKNMKKSYKFTELYILGIKNAIVDNNANMLVDEMGKAAESIGGEDDRITDYDLCAYYLMAILHLYKRKQDKLGFVDRIYNSIFGNSGMSIRSLEENPFIYYNADLIIPRVVYHLSEYMDYVENLYKQALINSETILFRGHSSVSYDLKPSLFRGEDWLNNEKSMYYELINRCPEEFERLKRHIDILAKMQHYALPTRLLDVTKNPLVAMYFAAQNKKEKLGEIMMFKVGNQNIKYSNSDTVALLASLPVFSKTEQTDLYFASKGIKSESVERVLGRLAAEVSNEKPFSQKIDEKDLTRALVCIPTQTNKRVIAQDGAFIVCGLFPEVYEPKRYSNEKTLIEMLLKAKSKVVVCFVANKDSILKELDHNGINKATLFPEIDTVSSYIKEKFS